MLNFLLICPIHFQFDLFFHTDAKIYSTNSYNFIGSFVTTISHVTEKLKNSTKQNNSNDAYQGGIFLHGSNIIF
jgi:hypothetical protein